ncbi:MAG: tail fiber domain-containing protein [Bacteroidetes bacterium]|nr:tail fiber domain-containing protein [Bacteroidota bacterium]
MKQLTFTVVQILILAGFMQTVSAQSTNIQLPTSNNTSSFDVLNIIGGNIFKARGDGKVGIGPVTNPRAQLEIAGLDGLLCTGTLNSGTATALGTGLRMHWYPRKGAFRVGMAESSYWDDNGSASPNLALYSIAMGYQPRATGVASTAIGAYNKSTGDYALSLGSYNYASASHSIAIGTQVYASGIYSIAIGSGCDTNGKDGAMVVGDDTYFQTAYASNDNQLTMRFSGGYRLWSSYPDSVAGVYMRGGASGWSNYCDRNKKENFTEIDGEQLLQKIHNMPITEWNYKGNTGVKYVGPMAQDFYAAFHLGGDDSLGISSIAIDGINMAGVQALENRTSTMKAEIELLKTENERLKSQLSDVNNLKEQIEEIKQLKSELHRQLEILKTNEIGAEIRRSGKQL